MTILYELRNQKSGSVQGKEFLEIQSDFHLKKGLNFFLRISLTIFSTNFSVCDCVYPHVSRYSIPPTELEAEYLF